RSPPPPCGGRARPVRRARRRRSNGCGGQPASGRILRPRLLFDSERDLDVRLVFDDAAALDARGPVLDVDPAHAADGLRGLRDGGANGVVPALVRRGNELDDLRNGHGFLLARRSATTVPLSSRPAPTLKIAAWTRTRLPACSRRSRGCSS